MNIIFFLKNFWIDFFAANHSRLMKNASYETPISTLLHLSFTQAVNFNTIFILILHFLFEVKLNFVILFSPIVIIALINSYYFYNKLNSRQRAEIINRKPNYKRLIYDMYDVFSTLLFIASLVLVSKYR
ncbi:hypothetical protein SAMN02927937_00220 [Paenimyroides aquimaris]|uniref:Uncharacterized protein n=1 Tax=Paenimyroides marinum TaxID=1159016 RepID=A0A1H6JBY9_9FLAO|nr:hypothetical protein SAMN02927937_00220 [Paenimyroides aquimaris]